MSTITKEWLQQKIADMEATRDDIPFGLGEDGTNTLAALRIALASLEAEAVYFINRVKYSDAYGDDVELRTYCCELDALKSKEDFGGEVVPVYTAPPTPVSVPDDVFGPLAHAYKELTPTFMRNHIDVFERYGIYPDGSAGIQAMRIALDGMNRRAAMLQGAENAESLHAVKASPLLHSSIKCTELLHANCRGESGGNSPVIPDGYALVPVEPTEDMIVNGFESEPDESFSDEKEWEAYDAMSGCQQAAHRAKLCWAAMIASAPKPEA